MFSYRIANQLKHIILSSLGMNLLAETSHVAWRVEIIEFQMNSGFNFHN